MAEENNWFVSQPRWGDHRPTIAQLDKETPQHIYYGKKTRTYRDRERQSFVEKNTIIVRDISRETAVQINAAWEVFSRKTAAANAERNRLVELAKEERERAIATLLPKPVEALS